MSQDEKYTAAIIGIASEVAKAVTIWELFRKLFLDFAEKAMAAAITFDEALSFDPKGVSKMRNLK